MTPAQFIARWKDNPLTERAGAQAHFDDLCELLGVDKPRDPAHYCFERGDGWADVWKRGHFGWENKKPGRDLKAALKQLTDYALELENPPLLVVSDREHIEIHTAFTGYPLASLPTKTLSSLPVRTMRPSASCIPAFTNCGRFVSARASKTARATPPPPPSKPSPSPPA